MAQQEEFHPRPPLRKPPGLVRLLLLLERRVLVHLHRAPLADDGHGDGDGDDHQESDQHSDDDADRGAVVIVCRGVSV